MLGVFNVPRFEVKANVSTSGFSLFFLLCRNSKQANAWMGPGVQAWYLWYPVSSESWGAVGLIQKWIFGPNTLTNETPMGLRRYSWRSWEPVTLAINGSTTRLIFCPTLINSLLLIPWMQSLKWRPNTCGPKSTRPRDDVAWDSFSFNYFVFLSTADPRLEPGSMAIKTNLLF